MDTAFNLTGKRKGEHIIKVFAKQGWIMKLQHQQKSIDGSG